MARECLEGASGSSETFLRRRGCEMRTDIAVSVRLGVLVPGDCGGDGGVVSESL